MWKEECEEDYGGLRRKVGGDQQLSMFTHLATAKTGLYKKGNTTVDGGNLRDGMMHMTPMAHMAFCRMHTFDLKTAVKPTKI